MPIVVERNDQQPFELSHALEEHQGGSLVASLHDGVFVANAWYLRGADALTEAKKRAQRTKRPVLLVNSHGRWIYTFKPPAPVECKGRTLYHVLNFLPAKGCRCLECRHVRELHRGV